MKILKVMILEKLHDKFKLEEAYIWDIKKHLTIVNRIPKDICSILISELINEKLLIKIDDRKYKLNFGTKKFIEDEKSKLQIIRNRTFI